jgi:dienelactone hydrolase
MKHLLSLLLLAALFACQPAEPELIEKEISYGTGDVSMNGYLVYDNSIDEKRPGVLVVHEWWGHNPYARERARKLAELGYVALAVDMYGNGKQAGHPEDAGKFAGEVMKNMNEAQARFEAALNILKNFDKTNSEKTAAIGYCFGGGVVLQMARMGVDLDGVVSFHGSIASQMPAEKGKVKAELLVLNGADDGFVTKDQIDAFKAEMDSADVEYKFINYQGAKHSFTNPDADSLGAEFNLPLAYDKTADEKSWNEMKNFFTKIFEKR